MKTFTKKSLDSYMGKDRPRTVVPLPDAGGTSVILRVMDADDLLSVEAMKEEVEAKGDLQARRNFCAFLLSRAIIDESGDRLYGDSDALDLLKLPVPAFTKIMQAATRLNGLTEEAIAKASKKSVRATSGASVTGGPSPSAKPSASSSKK